MNETQKRELAAEIASTLDSFMLQSIMINASYNKKTKEEVVPLARDILTLFHTFLKPYLLSIVDELTFDSDLEEKANLLFHTITKEGQVYLYPPAYKELMKDHVVSDERVSDLFDASVETVEEISRILNPLLNPFTNEED